MSQYNPSVWLVRPGGQRDQEHGVELHVHREGYQPPITYRNNKMGVAKYLKVSI